MLFNVLTFVLKSGVFHPYWFSCAH